MMDWAHLTARRATVARGGAIAVVLLASALLAGCSGLDLPGSSLIGANAAETSQVRAVRILVASTRKGEKDGGVAEPGRNVRFATTTVSVPPGHATGAIERPSFGRESRKSHVVIAGERRLDPASFEQELATQLSGRVGVSRDVLVFIHGFNVNYDEARWRLAQIVVDSGFTGVPVLFTWPSRSQILAYGSDRESATASRDELESLLTTLGNVPGVGRVHILAHSMGTWLAMEALRQSAIAGRASLGGHIGEVMLAAPDIDLDVFRAQMARVGTAARVSVFAAADDRALSVSRTLAGDRARLGALDLKNPAHQSELAGLNVRVYDLTDAQGGTDMFRHGRFAEAPQVVRTIGAQLAEPRIQDRLADQGQAQSFVDPAAAGAGSPERGAASPPGAVTREELAPPAL